MASSSVYGRWLSNPPQGEEVVITGISGRFPESNNVHEFKDNLFDKKDMVTDDDRRWKLDHPEIPQRNAKIYNIDNFDAGFFGVHHRQADVMDPMTRKFLETAVEAIMDAGINPSELEGSNTGVFVGACYADMEIETLIGITEPQRFGITGWLRSFIANRLSYYLKLRAPSFILDTACSSSFNALEAGFKAIRSGKCENAIIGGVNLLIHPGITRQFFRLGVLSSDGRCKVFDQKADGYVRGETIACIFLQKAKGARRIYGQVIYVKVNDDGFKPQGITFPSAKMQEVLMTEILEESGIKPSEIDFMEAHGTGTEVGDPEEVRAIDRAIARKRNKPLLIGAVKCSIGHTEPSSGLGSLAKVIIAMETGYIPPNINLRNVKKGLEGFDEGRITPVVEATGLGNENAVIGINNFGFGGNNVHAMVRRFGKSKRNCGLPEDDLPRLVCVSGRTKEAVSALLEDLNKKPVDGEFVGLLHQIFKTKIKNHLYRGFTILSKKGNLKPQIKKISHNSSCLRVYFGPLENSYKVLGQELMKFLCFSNTITEVNKFLNQNGIEKSDIFNAFAVQIGIAEMLKLLELSPTALYGDSLGKFATAHCYGEITLEEATQIISQTNKNTKETKSEHLPAKLNESQIFLLDAGKHDARGDHLKYEDLTARKNSPILDISDNSTDGSTFLELLGRLYLEGHDLQLHKLYPEIKFPVSRTTPMISPLIKWDYRKSWRTYKFGQYSVDNVTQEKYNVSSALYEEQKYIEGHVIDGRNLIPAAEYLNLVWKTLASSRKISENDLPVVFENCKFMRAMTMPKSSAIKLMVSIQRGSGYFEVAEKNSVIVSGRVYAPVDIKDYQTELKTSLLNEGDCSEILEQDDIYRELYLRGYNYSGSFKGIVKCNVDASVGLVRWEANWTTFIDKMLQMRILQMDTRLLYVPVGIQKLVINPSEHLKRVVNKNEALVPVYSYKDYNIVKSADIEICGIKATSIARRKPLLEPVLEKYAFIPNNTKLTLKNSVRVNTQIILENSLENNFKAVEILDDFTPLNADFILPLVSKALDDVPLVTLNLTISTKTVLDEIPGVKVEDFVLTSTSDMLLIVATKILQRPSLLKQALSSLSSNGYILAREEVDFVPSDLELEILTVHITPREKFILFRKSQPITEYKYIEINSSSLEWLPKLQDALTTASDVLVYSNNQGPEGVVGLVNCIRREPGGKKVRCFFTMDETLKFDPLNPFYEAQIMKNTAFNIYKGGTWGTYRHLLLNDAKQVESLHSFVNSGVKGDISSLKWFEGHLSSQTKLPSNKILVYNYYSSINFKDVMAASGRVNIDALTTDRLQQECLIGLEFSGIDTNGRRVIGMVSNAALTTILVADQTFVCYFPKEWSFEDAATVIVVYVTVIYALLEVIRIKPGTSILIHSATGGIGLAALNVCMFYGCEIYVTVGTEEKRKYLRQHFPQISECRIGNSRDTSFEEMIKRETKGRGVDVVLNSLSEEKLRASVRCVAHGGDFLEIGKFDMGIDSAFNLLLLERNVNYHGVMLDRIFLQSPEIKARLVEAIYKGIRLGYVKPLPRMVFERHEVEKAFRYMMTGKHIGKVLVKIRNEDDKIDQVFPGVPRFFCDSEKTYIIVGGLGGFGLELADWLFLRGAQKLVLVTHSGIQNGYQKQRIRIWQSSGVTVQISTRDVTTRQGCLDLIEESSKLGPVDAVFNLAAILKDGLFENQTQDTFSEVFAPKAEATIFLDKVTREMCSHLQYFVVFSSVSCGRGNPGQTNYGMANSIMERICEKRKEDGLPGLAIQWGAIGDVGLVAKMQKENKELVIGGTLQQKVASCFEVLDKFLKQEHPVVASMVVAEKNSKSYGSGSAVDAVAYILGIKDIKTVGYNTTFAELGLDSMMGTEMIQSLEKDFEIYITAKDVRNLTFAKLIELEAEQKQNTQTVTNVEKGTSFLLQYIPRTNIKYSPLVKLSSQEDTENLAKVFMLPGIEGVLEPLENITKNLNAHVFGAQYNYHNPEESIEECCKNLLPCIEQTLANDKVFNIIGYSFGTAVATELVAQLEAKGYKGNLIAIDGSPQYLTAAIKEQFPSQTQNEFETLMLFKILSLLLPIELLVGKKEQFIKCETFDERVNLAISLIPPGTPRKDDLEKQGAVALYNRFKSVVRYRFVHNKIKSSVHLFKAKFTLLDKFDDDYKFSELCEQAVTVTLVDGDHGTILNRADLVECINNILLSNSC